MNEMKVDFSLAAIENNDSKNIFFSFESLKDFLRLVSTMV